MPPPPNPSQPHAEPLQQRLSSNRNSCSLPPTKPLAFRHRLSKTPLTQAKFPIATGQAVCCFEIDATDHWQGSVTNLPVTDSNGNTYYYWAVEEPVTGYTPSYLFQDADGSAGANAIKSRCTRRSGTDIIILNTKQDTSYTLPSTGGTGVTRYYLIGLLLMGGSGLVVCYQFRRKRHGNCAK